MEDILKKIEANPNAKITYEEFNEALTKVSEEHKNTPSANPMDSEERAARTNKNIKALNTAKKIK